MSKQAQTQKQEKVFLINESVRNGLLAYMQERPYKEVAAGIQALANLAEHKMKMAPNEMAPLKSVKKARPKKVIR